MKEQKPIEKPKIEVSITRDEGKTWLNFKIDPRITEIFKAKSEEIRESEKWKGLKFYYCPEIINDDNYKQKLYNARLMDEFGSGIYKNGHLNIAWVRTVGGEGRVVIPDTLSFSDIVVSLNSYHNFTKKYFEEYYQNFNVKSVITVDF